MRDVKQGQEIQNSEPDKTSRQQLDKNYKIRGK